ncbi:MAG TPA: hypothetical protein VFU82_06025, partial [Gammaproteobacteria bacterium]|nr:hypothetical protein [Gammaproteobacteria bacterium]
MTKSAVKSGKFYADMSPKEHIKYLDKNIPVNMSWRERRRRIASNNNLGPVNRHAGSLFAYFKRFEESTSYPSRPETTGIVSEFLWQYERYSLALNYSVRPHDHVDTYFDFHKGDLMPLYEDLVRQLRIGEFVPDDYNQKALKELTCYLDTIYKDLSQGICSHRRVSSGKPSQKYITELDNLLKSINSPERLSPPIK